MSIEIQRAVDADCPLDADFTHWVAAALSTQETVDNALTLRIVDRDEITALNRDYRDKNKATNVLSFPTEPIDIPGLPPEAQAELAAQLGDIAICAEIVAAEAAEQGKPIDAHWAHMTIHGVLHLLGHDHIETSDAEAMEALEIKLLADFGYSNPYISNKE